MKKLSLVLLLFLVVVGVARAQGNDHWPQWRGPFFNGMGRGDAPTEWSDTKNIKWKTEIPGRGFSTPVVWGDRIFLTTAIPTGKVAETPQPAPAEGQGRRAGGGAGPLVEHRFEVLALDRKPGTVDRAAAAVQRLRQTQAASSSARPDLFPRSAFR